MIRRLALLSLAVCPAFGATLSINPNSVPSNYAGSIDVTVNGLASGETVQIERFIDLNSNGVIDTGEPLISSFLVTDGKVVSIGAARNTNIPGDEDLTANSQIRTTLRFPQFPEIGMGAGASLFRVSSPQNRFAPTQAAFSVTQPSYPQAVTGAVTVNGAVAASAFVAALDGTGTFFAGALSDAAGKYRMNLPAGNYMLLAFKSGSIGNFNSAAKVSLAAGATATANINNAAGNRVISGKIADVDSGAGLPGVQFFVEDDNGDFTLAVTDRLGNYSATVSAQSNWQVQPSENSLAMLGYLRAHSQSLANTLSGNATLNVGLPKATALVYGTVKDQAGKPVVGLEIRGHQQMDGGLRGSGTTDASGNYSVGLIQGSWSISPDGDSLKRFGLLGKNKDVTLAGNQFTRADLDTKAATAHLRGRVVDDQDNPVDGDVYMFASDPVTGWSSETGADGSGNFDLPVFAGTWNVSITIENSPQSYVVPQLSFVVQDNIDQNNLTLRLKNPTAHINGSVRDNSSRGLSGIDVYAYATINGLNYNVNSQTDGSGNFSLPVINGSWSVGVNCRDIEPLQLQCPQNQTISISGANANITLVASSQNSVGPQITTTSLPDGKIGLFYSAMLEATGGQQPLTWSLGPRSALPPGLSIEPPTGLAWIQGTPTKAGTFQFTIRVTDAIGRSFDQSFTMNVSAGVQIDTGTLPDASVSSAYLSQLQGSGGQQPYFWVFVAGSLPSGINLSSSGAIQGITTQLGTFTFTVRLIDSTGQIVEKTLNLNVTSGATAQPKFTSASIVNGQLRVLISGTIGSVVTVEASTDLEQWTPVGTVAMNAANAEFVDTATSQHSQRFYRLK